MKKNHHEKRGGNILEEYFSQTMRIIRVGLFFIVVSTTISWNTTSYSQSTSLSLDMKDVTVGEVIKAIENQSEFLFLYQGGQVDLNRRVSIQIDRKQVQEILKELFKGTDNIYTVDNRKIIINKASRKILDNHLAATEKNLRMDLQQPQQREITGKVTDVSGEPLPGASVMVKGTNIGTITDKEGRFSLRIPSNAQILQISFVGMKSQEIPIEGRTMFNVVLEEETTLLQEVVAVGYGTMTKRDLSASVSSIKSDKIEERTYAFNIMESMAGKLPGVRNVSFSGKPGGASSLRIRGMGSINADSNPIYVLDGVVGVDPSIINPTDIESIDVLKDAAATAMYGAKGANGVVLITTKSGKKDRGTFSYNGKIGVGLLTRKIDVLNAEEYMEVQRRAYAYSGKVMPHLQTPMEKLFYYAKDASGNYLRDENGYLIASPKYDTDWQDAITRNAPINDHNLTFTGGSEKSTIYANIGYQDFEGLVKYTYSKRLTGTLNIKSDIKEWLNLQALITTGFNKINDMEGGFGQGPVRNMIEMPPIVPVKYEDGTWGRKNDYPLGEAGEDPILLLKEQKNIWDGNFTILNLISTFKFTNNFHFTAKGDLQTSNKRHITYAKAGLLDVSETNNGYADIYNEVSKKWSNEDYFSYHNNFFNNQLVSDFVLGASWYYYRLENSSGGSENYFDDSFEYYNLGAGTTFHKPSSGMDQNTMNSFYFRMNHSFRDKYLLGLTLRADGASNFGENNKYGFFPSVSGAWRISEENFFESAKPIINNLKLRLSYGLVGNASIPNYKTISSYSNSSVIFNKSLQPYVVLSNLGNEDLKWETSKQFNAGMDIGFLNNRIEILMDYYNKATTNLLFLKQVPYTTGYSNTWTNLGEIANRGFELTLSSRNIANKNFVWSTDIIFSTNKLLVIDIGGETIDTGNGTVAKEGEEWASYFILNRIGTWGLNEVAEAAVYGKKPGDLKYEDVNKDGIINDDDRKLMGNGMPKGEINMGNTFRYKGFSLMLDLNCQYGAKILGITTTMLENRQLYGNSRKTVLDAWTPEHQNTMIAAIRLPSDPNFGENEKDSRML
ncbi:MAG TPA: TonB-dependent receptor, partial [Paludibacteraceae bacterium]|nr:TonB-dependent receptor [Paludibacteraceae bacterium]